MTPATTRRRHSALSIRVCLTGTLSALLLILVAYWLSSSAGATNASTTPKAKVASLAYGDFDEADTAFAPVLDGLTSLSKKLGIHLYTYNNNDSATTGLSNAQTMVEEKPTVIIEWNGVASIGASLARVFSGAHAKCIAVNVPISGCPFFDLTPGAIGYAEGTVVANLAKRRGWTAANTTVVLVDDPAAGYTINLGDYGFYVNFAKKFPKMKQMTAKDFSASTTHVGNLNAVLVNGAANLQTTYTALTTALETIPKSRHLVVQTFNDTSALGAVRALTQAKLDHASEAMVIGQSIDSVGLEDLRTNPVWVADSSFSVSQWPRLLIAMADAMLNGVKPPALTLPAQFVVTKANIDQYYHGDQQVAYPALPSADDYLKPYLADAQG